MKSAYAVKASGLVLMAVVLALLTVQGSYALWNTAASSDAGTVQGADFRISLTDTLSGHVTDMTLDDGTVASLALSSTSAGTVIPGHSSYSGVQVENLTDAGGAFTVRASTGTPIIGGSTGSSLAQYLSLTTVSATSLAECSQGALYDGVVSTGSATIEIAKNGTGVLCFQITLSATMPGSLTGQSAQVAIPITVNQL